MFVVMGATGQTGGAVLRELRRRGARVRAITRDPERASLGEGVEVVRGDLMDGAGLAQAFAGADAAYVMLPNLPQAEHVLAASKAAARTIADTVRDTRVRRVVALSSCGAHLAEGTGVVRTLYDFEAELRTTDAAITFLRAGDFMENWAAVLPSAQSDGILPSGRVPLDSPMQTVSALDVGACAAALLLDPAPAGSIVNLLGPKDYTPNDVAAVLSRLLGRPVTAVTASREDILAGLLAARNTRDGAEKLVELTDALNTGHLVFESVGEIWRGSVTLEESLRHLVSGPTPGQR